MNAIVWLIAGAALGWITTIITRRRQAILGLNLIAGSLGAFVAGYLISPMFNSRAVEPGAISVPALLVALVGAAIVLTAVNYNRRENNVKSAVIEGRWELVRKNIHTRWGRITDEDIDTINGDHTQFVQILQRRYGYDQREAEDQIQRFLKAISGLT